MSRPDIVIVKPGSQKAIYAELSQFELTAIEPPLWASLLAGFMRGQGYGAVLLDAEVEEWSYEECARQIRDINPVLAVVSVSGSNPSASTMNMYGAGEIIRSLKKIAPEIKTMLQGLHPSALPQQTMEEEVCDFLCQGEGFYTLPETVDALKNNASEFKVRGLWWRKGDDIIANPTAPIFQNLDQLPMPAWDLLPMKKYRAHNWHCFDDIENRQPYGTLYTSLGCPYNCTFCCINALFGKPGIRHRSARSVVDEVAFMVKNWGIKNIKIIDELFADNEERVVEICDLLIERNYDLNMWAYARVNTVTQLMLDKMKAAGINWVAYGFESGSPRVLKAVRKAYNPESIMSTVQQTYDAGLYVGANFIFGLPEDDLESMHETLQLAQEINAHWANLYSTMAFPGSKLYTQALKNDWPLPETWTGYSQYSPDCHPLPTKYLTPGEILSFRDYAFHTYFENPVYLDKISKTFGIETAKHITQMSKHRLKRNCTQFENRGQTL
ncbi:MAG TPA: B12-binding domain-containing radical SAM protein [Desulfovibrio sp.]|nr:B12-binding domain-containing radical SAM protein [Desulfovibrio sp.]